MLLTLLLKLQDYTFDLKYLWGRNIFVNDALSGLHIKP